MPVQACPRCKHFNPEYAAFCYFDGVVLQAQQNMGMMRLPNEFVFPSGRRCKTFDELAQGCQEEWGSARNLLVRGTFGQFFRACNRADLARAADDAKAQTNPDKGVGISSHGHSGRGMRVNGRFQKSDGAQPGARTTKICLARSAYAARKPHGLLAISTDAANGSSPAH